MVLQQEEVILVHQEETQWEWVHVTITVVVAEIHTPENLLLVGIISPGRFETESKKSLF